MALRKAKPSELPEDAIRLSRADAIEHQFKTMYDWKDWKDSFFFKYGASILAGTSAAVGIYLNDYYRSKLRVRSYGSVSSFLAMALMPAGCTMVFHHGIILPDVVLQDSCAVCTEIRAASLQAVFGCAIPAIMAPMASFSTALNYGTYNVPYIYEPMKVIALWRKLTKPIGNVLFGLFLAQALLASGITILETRSIHNVNNKIEKMYQDSQDSSF